ncbi:MAG: cytochrome C [Cytophagaceae bacterium]|nr:cytochrome C [Cytophagaceae bacterium]|tara:strand:+ start:10475 stop:11830 length:1356 start_codon:yes stop_codon:yes gene_type:complete
MKQVKYLKSTSRITFFGLAFCLSFFNLTFAQDAGADAQADAQQEVATDAPVTAGADAAAGEALFKANCAACHKLYSKATGPALYDVTSRHDRQWLYNWIHDSQGMVKAGDPNAVALFNENNNQVMTPFPQLSEADIDNILAYTDTPKPEPVAPVPGAGGGGSGSGSGASTNLILGGLVLVFLMLVTVLFLVNKTLRRFATEQGVELPVKEKGTPIWKAFVQNQFLVLVSVIVLVLGGAYFAYGFLMQVGVDQGYEPIQPIHYSHRIHAGDNQIECKYCHSSARTSKTSGIPTLNVCMNCHKTVSEVADQTSKFTSVTEDYSKEFYDKEIQKLYKAVGWDQATQSYTRETHPVKWVRIHNLPDFVYFNHSQHVSVAGVQCQTCHGPIEEMEIVHQEAPLTMGWCINCHRETNVVMEGNEYYEKIHDELAKKYDVEQLTIAQMGGIECGKCHY